MNGTPRIGGDLALEAITALGATAVVGLPGQHALGLFDALRRSSLTYLSSRVENNAGFMAEGLARSTGTVAPLLLSTGPGALTSLAALQEAKLSSTPVLAIAAQVPVAGLGGGRHGFLHELPEQSAAFAQVVKHVRTVRTISQIVPAIHEAWQIAESAPAGPVLVEIPQDILLESADALPAVAHLTSTPQTPAVPAELVAAAAATLSSAERPVIFAGGGVKTPAAREALRELAERLGAPVATTFGGKSAFAWDHPLSLQSWIEDRHTTDALEQADVLLAVGTGLGELSSNYFTLQPGGSFIHIEADLGKVTSNHPGLGIHAAAEDALPAIVDLVSVTDSEARQERGAQWAGSVRERVQQRIDSQPLAKERQLLEGLRAAVASDVDTFWDMTVLAYWAWSAWDPRGGLFASAQGAGGLGYGLPAAMGAALGIEVAGDTRPVLAVSGDGGAMYSIAELATLAQHQLDVTWLIIDDGGYGILRDYMEAAFGASTATELSRPNFVELVQSFGIEAEIVEVADAPQAVAESLAAKGPRVIVVETHLDLFAPTHLDA
ncbi:thiamine pyrophosphate-binding protein [Leucobacter chinensis]|uniref:thiamine pyrophosphate-binding protein n=1 Tax=Leucobacter chinensis TaxID=2851010 RepID=UPI001C210E8B|nr:thiamine pyrophosphate-binding protein [Leucobacter chinensis]